MHTNNLESTGYNAVMGFVRDSWDPYDQFGCVQEWRFAICELLLFDFGHLVPEFRTMASEPELDNYAVEQLRPLWNGHNGDFDMAREHFHYEHDLKRVLLMLNRYRAWLGLAGKDY
jgi:hypothetical protein